MTCGTGFRNKIRTKDVLENNGGSCVGNYSEIEECNNNNTCGL